MAARPILSASAAERIIRRGNRLVFVLKQKQLENGDVRKLHIMYERQVKPDGVEAFVEIETISEDALHDLNRRLAIRS